MLFKLILLFDVLLNADKPASPNSGSPPQLTPPQSPFLEIHASMMEKMLDKTNEVGAIINGSISGIRNNREKYRLELKDFINLHDDEPATRNANLSTCGVDGAYVVERLLGTDLLFSCAIVTEGLFVKPHSQCMVKVFCFCLPQKG
jgi:hypothetical protein